MNRWLLIPAILGLACVHVVLDGDTGVRSWLNMRHELRATQARVAASRTRRLQLRREAAALENDPLAVERAVRERLRLARPGETIVRTAVRTASNPRIP